MIRGPILLAASSLLLCAQYVPRQPAPGTDGQYHPTIESSHSFECGTIRAGLRYRQERLPEEGVPRLEDTLRVTLLRLTVSERSVSRSDLDTAQALFRSFAWIQDISAMCYGGRVTIDVKGMPLAPYAASLNNNATDDTPDLRTRSIRLSRGGIEYVSPQRW